jgi:hypothetical protein
MVLEEIYTHKSVEEDRETRNILIRICSTFFGRSTKKQFKIGRTAFTTEVVENWTDLLID